MRRIADPHEPHVRRTRIGRGVQRLRLRLARPRHRPRIDECDRRRDLRHRGAQVGGHVLVHRLCRNARIGCHRPGRHLRTRLGAQREPVGDRGRGGGIGGLAIARRLHVAHRLRARFDHRDGRGRREQRADEGQRIDDHQLARIARMRLGQHQRGEPAHRMADHRGACDLFLGDQRVQVRDHAVQHARRQIRPRCIAAEAVDLHHIDTMGLRKARHHAVPHRARGGQAGDQDDRAALAGRHDRDMRHPRFGRRRRGMARRRLQDDAQRQGGGGKAHTEKPDHITSPWTD